MKETLYAIPVNEAFASGDDCPLCRLRAQVEEQSLDVLMRSAYMEPDCRIRTNRLGFCRAHLARLSALQNRLGLALMLETHIQELIAALERDDAGASPGGLPFSRLRRASRPSDLRRRITTCALCEQTEQTMQRYVATVMYLYAHDAAFAERLRACPSLCLPHLCDIIEAADARLTPADAAALKKALTAQTLSHLRTLEDRLAAFSRQFDYRAREPARADQGSVIEDASDCLRGRIAP